MNLIEILRLLLRYIIIGFFVALFLNILTSANFNILYGALFGLVIALIRLFKFQKEAKQTRYIPDRIQVLLTRDCFLAIYFRTSH